MSYPHAVPWRTPWQVLYIRVGCVVLCCHKQLLKAESHCGTPYIYTSHFFSAKSVYSILTMTVYSSGGQAFPSKFVEF